MNEPASEADFIESLRRCQPSLPTQTPETFYRAGWAAALQNRQMDLDLVARSTAPRATWSSPSVWRPLLAGLTGLAAGLILGIGPGKNGAAPHFQQMVSQDPVAQKIPDDRQELASTAKSTASVNLADRQHSAEMAGTPELPRTAVTPTLPRESTARNTPAVARRHSRSHPRTWDILSSPTWAIVSGSAPAIWKNLAEPLPELTSELSKRHQRAFPGVEIDVSELDFLERYHRITPNTYFDPNTVILRSRPLTEENWKGWD